MLCAWSCVQKKTCFLTQLDAICMNDSWIVVARVFNGIFYFAHIFTLTSSLMDLKRLKWVAQKHWPCLYIKQWVMH